MAILQTVQDQMQACKMAQCVEVLAHWTTTWILPPDPTGWHERAVLFTPYSCAHLHIRPRIHNHIHNTKELWMTVFMYTSLKLD